MQWQSSQRRDSMAVHFRQGWEDKEIGIIWRENAPPFLGTAGRGEEWAAPIMHLAQKNDGMLGWMGNQLDPPYIQEAVCQWGRKQKRN